MSKRSLPPAPTTEKPAPPMTLADIVVRVPGLLPDELDYVVSGLTLAHWIDYYRLVERDFGRPMEEFVDGLLEGAAHTLRSYARVADERGTGLGDVEVPIPMLFLVAEIIQDSLLRRGYLTTPASAPTARQCRLERAPAAAEEGDAA